MNIRILVAAILLALLFIDVGGEKTGKHKKWRRRKVSTTSTEAYVENEVDGDLHEELEAPEEPLGESTETKDVIDLCTTVHCGAGKICEIGLDNEPRCVCIPECQEESDSRRKVCSNHNETFPSDCAIYQQRCWCDEGDSRCMGSEYKHVHIEYYGVCRQMPECTPEEMADFPRRMRDWLFNVMRDMADRKELTPHFLKLEREAEFNLTRRWTNAAIWKWCDLDGNPPDRSVSRHELFPIRAPLMALEHCIAPFLNKCDSDNDHHITLEEWGICLELDEDELEDKCDAIAEG